jgi:hypothetical protein
MLSKTEFDRLVELLEAVHEDGFSSDAAVEVIKSPEFDKCEPEELQKAMKAANFELGRPGLAGILPIPASTPSTLKKMYDDAEKESEGSDVFAVGPEFKRYLSHCQEVGVEVLERLGLDNPFKLISEMVIDAAIKKGELKMEMTHEQHIAIGSIAFSALTIAIGVAVEEELNK